MPMTRNTRISATRPVFPSFLLPSFPLALHRRRRAASLSPSPSSSSSSSPSTSPSTAASSLPSSSPSTSPSTAASSLPSSSPSSSPALSSPAPPPRLARVAPDTLRCMACSTDLALASQIISKGFTGRYGRAFLVAPPPPPADQALANVRVGRSEDRQLVTGWHVVADICCATCSRKIGWKYVDAREPSQKYKVGKYILEVERVATHRGWDDAEHMGIIDEEDEPQPTQSPDDVVFDSDDEEECDELFAGVWNAETVAKRRSQALPRRATSMAE